MFQRAEPLLALFQRHSIVVVRVKNQRRRLYVLCIFQRRAVPIHFEFVEHVSAKVALVAVGSVASALIADEVRDAAERDCGFEYVSVAHYPVGHVSAIASAGQAKAAPVYPRIFLEDSVDAVHYVDVVFAAPFADYTALELFAISGRAARIAEEHSPTAGRIYLKLVEPINSIGAGRASVDAENHRIALAFLPTHGLYKEAVHIPAVSALVRDALDVLKLELLPQRFVNVRHLAPAAVTEVGAVEVVYMLEVIFEIHHPAALFVDIDAADCTFARRNRP